MRTLIAIAAVALAGAAFLIGRSTAEAPAVPPRAAAHAHEGGCKHPPPEVRVEPTTVQKAEATQALDALRTDLRRIAVDRSAQLNDLQNFLAANLAEGKITPAQVVGMFRTETDAAALDVLQGVLSANPELADAPGVTDAFLELARDDKEPARRQAAVAFLGSAWDKDGRVKDALIGLARGEKDNAVRLSALGTLQAYVVKNRDRAEAVTTDLLAIAKGDPSGEIRAQALTAVEIRSAGDKAVPPLLDFLADPAPEARLAAADKLGESPPASRSVVVGALERALAVEPEPHVKQMLLANLVRAGRAESIQSLERTAARDAALKPHAEDYLAILKEGYVDWNDISTLKGDREAARRK